MTLSISQETSHSMLSKTRIISFDEEQGAIGAILMLIDIPRQEQISTGKLQGQQPSLASNNRMVDS